VGEKALQYHARADVDFGVVLSAGAEAQLLAKVCHLMAAFDCGFKKLH
jgi:hypothetical protein